MERRDGCRRGGVNAPGIGCGEVALDRVTDGGNGSLKVISMVKMKIGWVGYGN